MCGKDMSVMIGFVNSINLGKLINCDFQFLQFEQYNTIWN